MNLTISHRETDATSAAITLSGRLLLGPGCAELERLLADLLARGFLHLTFDLSEVTHIDSTGMGRFIDAYTKLRKAGGTLKFAGATGAVRQMFRVTRLDSVFQFV